MRRYKGADWGAAVTDRARTFLLELGARPVPFGSLEWLWRFGGCPKARQQWHNLNAVDIPF